jgi:hypothetical protein
MTEARKYPTDIWSIKKYGVEDWYQNYQPWPVSELEKYNIHNDLYDSYVELILESDGQDSGILAVLIRLLLEYHSLIYFELSLIRLKNSGYTPFFDDNVVTVFQNIYKKVYRGILFINKNKLNPDPLSSIQVVRNRIKSFYNCFSYQNKSDMIAPPWSKTTLYSYGYPKDYLLEYAKQTGEKVKIISPYSSIFKTKINHDNFSLTEKIFKMYEIIAIKYQLEISKEHKKYFFKLTNSAIKNHLSYKAMMVNFFTKSSPKTFLVPAFGWTEIRTFCQTARENGHTIIGATHGNNNGIYKHDDWYYTDFVMCDKYVVRSKNSIENFVNYQNKYKLSKKYKTKIISLNEESIKPNNINKNLRFKNSTKKIMLVEFPHVPFLVPQPMLTNNFQLWLCIKLSKLLKREGFYTIMKRHPDRLKETEGLYENYFDSVIKEPFEKVYRMTDAIIFPDVTSTTFPFALLKDKPILIFETLLKYFISDHNHKQIKSRCTIIPSYFDDDNRFIFEEKDLLDSLK